MPKLSLPHTQQISQFSRLQASKDPEHKDFQMLLQNLTENKLFQFHLGCKEKELRSKRDLRLLLKTIENQYLVQLATHKFSFLDTIKIGWYLPGFAIAPIIKQVIPYLLQRPAQVKHLELNVDRWLPKPALIYLVSWTTLESLTLRGIKIVTHSGSEPLSKSNEFDLENIIEIVPEISPTLTSLSLIDCDIRTHHITRLCEFLKRKRNLKLLNLRLNRDIGGGWEELLSLNVPALNLSLCDMNSDDGRQLTSGLRGKSTLKHLNLSGNYRLTHAIPELVQVVSTNGLVELDCSYCEIDDATQSEVFRILAEEQHCQLRSLKMQGVIIEDTEPLINCIYKNTSLQRLILNHPKNKYIFLKSASVKRVLQAIKENYFLHTFQVNVRSRDQHLLNQMEFWFQLNRCGRSILYEGPSKVQQRDIKPWITVLDNASKAGDVELMYWLVRHGAGLF